MPDYIAPQAPESVEDQAKRQRMLQMLAQQRLAAAKQPDDQTLGARIGYPGSEQTVAPSSPGMFQKLIGMLGGAYGK